ncbi:HIT family protein [Aquamicrobium zhengzhouense]|uniref:HIT family protein n=1 Tax=Aquamicrobium zhengzhouense TaxID=2781738 RepID=A0ABS0S8C7_9HYPH|nr:HIT family protein [Aquamicrobium zhengzhouense]MBI1619544.1 HIT family protein [Aquamicrobium zhengzhouense]
MTAPAYDPENIFAKILRGDLPAHKVYEDEATFVFMDIMPRGDGHCLVIPKLAARNILDVDAESLAAVARTTQKLARAVKTAFSADGVTVQQFNETAGGQVVFHLHVHVIPRFEGVALKPHTGQMEDQGVLAANAEKIRAALAA